MGKRGGAWKPDGKQAWGIWPGAQSPSQRPWRSQQEGWTFTAFDAEPIVIKEDGRDIAKKALLAEGIEDDAKDLMHDLQSILNGARRAEGRMARACKAREQTKAQWCSFDAKLKAVFQKEKRRYEAAMERHEKEVAAAREAQAAARRLIRQTAFTPTELQSPIPMEEEDGDAWEKMKADWEGQKGKELSDVFRRAMEEAPGGPPITPMRGVHAAPRTPMRGSQSTPRPTTDPYFAADNVAPLVSPAPTGATPVGVGADVPSPSAPVRRDKPSTPRVGPYAGDLEKDQIETAPPGLSGRLAEAKRKAMLPFRGGVTGTMDNVEAVAQAARATLLDDDPDEELTRAGPGKTAASPGLGRME